ncbi:MAG: uracil-DNA glycosylase, partial [Alphaproteobacteria bacterium]
MQTDRDESLAALHWLIQAGADEAIGDVPRDRTAVPPPAPAAITAQAPPKPSPPPTTTPTTTDGGLISNDAALASARDLARAAETLEELRAALITFDGCPL